MSDKITKRTAQDKEFLKSKTVYSVPDNASDKGFSASQLKSKMADPSLILFDWLQKLSDETSSGFDYFEEDLEETVAEVANKLYDDDFIANHQATATVVINALTNLNGRYLSAYETTTVTTSGNYNALKITKGGEKLTVEQARDYMEYMTGSRFLPVFEYEKPQNSMWIMADGTFWKPQYDLVNGMMLYAVPNPFELNGNKVTSLSNQSSDTTYPTAKCVWDNLVNVREVAEGKCKSIVISYLSSAPTTDAEAQLLKKMDGTNFTDLTDFADYVEYNSVAGVCINSRFNSQDLDIAMAQGSSEYIITKDRYVLKAGVSGEEDFGLKTGDLILVVETDVPDRWWAKYADSAFKLETSKVDLTNYFAKSESAIPTNNGTQDLGSEYYTWKDLYLSGAISINNNSAIKSFTSTNTEVDLLRLSTSNNLIIGDSVRINNLLTYKTFRPQADVSGQVDLGAPAATGIWRDLYLSRNLTDGTNTVTVAESMAQFNPTASGSTEIKWSQMLSFSLSTNTTFTFETAKTNCLNEYKAIISNSGASTITITLPSGVSIETNDDNIVVSSNTFTLPSDTTIELNCVNNWCVVYNHSAN